MKKPNDINDNLKMKYYKMKYCVHLSAIGNAKKITPND